MNRENTEQLIEFIKSHDDVAVVNFYQEKIEKIEPSFLWKFYAQQLCSALYELNLQNDYTTIHTLLQTFERLQFLKQNELLCACIFYELGHEAESYMDSGVFISASRLSHFYIHLKPTHNLSQKLYQDLSQIIALLQVSEQRYDLKEHLLARSKKNTLEGKSSKTEQRVKRSKI